MAQDWQHTQESGVKGAPSCGFLPWRSHTCDRSEYHMAALALDFQIDCLERTHYCNDPLHQQCWHRGEFPGTCGAPEPTPTQASDLPAWDPVHHPTMITPSFQQLSPKLLLSSLLPSLATSCSLAHLPPKNSQMHRFSTRDPAIVTTRSSGNSIPTELPARPYPAARHVH